MRVVIDCNVVISAGLNRGTCRKVINSVVGAHDCILSTEILTEYLTVARREKFAVAKDTLEQLIFALSWNAHFVSRKSSRFVLPDPHDQVYLDVALTGNADVIVTGNRRHFPKPVYNGIRIVSPSQFIEIASA